VTQQVIDIGSAPDDGTGDPLRLSFDKTNENFTELYAKGATEGLWNYNQTSTDTSTTPVSGRFKTNSGNYRDATQIAIHATTIQGIDRSSTLRTMLVGDLIQCQDSTNPAAWCRFGLQSLAVDHGTWFQLNVALQADGGVASGDNQEIVFVFTAGSGVGSGAPVDAEYITSSTNATLTAERVLTDTATVTWDRTTAGQIKANAVASGGTGPPQGRLTLQTATPVMTTTQSAKTTIFYTPYTGLLVPIYSGTSFAMTSIGAELSQTTTDTTKSPAAVAANSLYDLYVWSDGGTMRCTRGPAWTSATARGTGAGTSELVKVNGIWLNNVAITNGPAAQRGTYVGTVRSNGSSQIDWTYGTVAAGGGAGVFGIWNAYNRRYVESHSGNNANSWTYASTTVRAANAANTTRHSFICGLEEDVFSADYVAATDNAGSIGVGYDATNAFSGRQGTNYNASAATVTGTYSTTAFGFHFFQACEVCDLTSSNFYGDNNIPAREQGGLVFKGWM
jgi:hypothetical protein